jgi:methionyl-tRNA formyltransferase
MRIFLLTKMALAEDCIIEVVKLGHTFENISFDVRSRREFPELERTDVVISFCYAYRIQEPLISGPKFGCINIHPALLPEYRGFAVYNFGILNKEKEWGVTAHYVDRHFDTGDIIQRRRFSIDPYKETAVSLRDKTHRYMMAMFRSILLCLREGDELSRRKQVGGEYYSKRMMEEKRILKGTETPEEIDRRIRAFWYPPYPGAAIKINGEEFTLVNQQILEEIARGGYTGRLDRQALHD